MWILFGTFWPVIGMTVVALSAVFFQRARWWLLFYGPLAVLFPCFAFGEIIGANGNMLFMLLYLGLLMGLWLYYPVLCVIGAIFFYRRAREDESAY